MVLSDDRRCPQSLQNGQQLIVSLPSNPTTGYRWILHESAPEQLRGLGPEVFSNPKDDVIGGDGLYLAFRSAAGRQRSALPDPRRPMASRPGCSIVGSRCTEAGPGSRFRYNAAPFFQHAAATVSHDPDRLFAQPLARVQDFVFNEDVARVFPT